MMVNGYLNMTSGDWTNQQKGWYSGKVNEMFWFLTSPSKKGDRMMRSPTDTWMLVMFKIPRKGRQVLKSSHPPDSPPWDGIPGGWSGCHRSTGRRNQPTMVSLESAVPMVHNGNTMGCFFLNQHQPTIWWMRYSCNNGDAAADDDDHADHDGNYQSSAFYNNRTIEHASLHMCIYVVCRSVPA